MSHIPIPPEDEQPRETIEGAAAPESLDPMDGGDREVLAQPPVGAVSWEDATAIDPSLARIAAPPTVDELLDASAKPLPDALGLAREMERELWQDPLAGVAEPGGLGDSTTGQLSAQNFLGRRDSPHQITRLPYRPGQDAGLPRAAQLSHRSPASAAMAAASESPVLDFRPPADAASPASAGSALPSAAQPSGEREYRPLGYPRPMALVQLADYEQFFLAEQDSLINRLSELAREIAKQEIDHAAWVDYIHQRAILGPH